MKNYHVEISQEQLGEHGPIVVHVNVTCAIDHWGEAFEHCRLNGYRIISAELKTNKLYIMAEKRIASQKENPQ
jgi:hypothetical protein